jgi:hypothetical protein
LTPFAADRRLGELRHVITLVDGTLLKALPQIAEAMWLTSHTGTPPGGCTPTSPWTNTWRSAWT